MSKFRAGMLAFFALILCMGGGCVIGERMVHPGDDSWNDLGGALNGGLIGAGVGLVLALGIYYLGSWRP